MKTDGKQVIGWVVNIEQLPGRWSKSECVCISVKSSCLSLSFVYLRLYLNAAVRACPLAEAFTVGVMTRLESFKGPSWHSPFPWYKLNKSAPAHRLCFVNYGESLRAINVWSTDMLSWRDPTSKIKDTQTQYIFKRRKPERRVSGNISTRSHHVPPKTPKLPQLENLGPEQSWDGPLARHLRWLDGSERWKKRRDVLPWRSASVSRAGIFNEGNGFFDLTTSKERERSDQKPEKIQLCQQHVGTSFEKPAEPT